MHKVKTISKTIIDETNFPYPKFNEEGQDAIGFCGFGSEWKQDDYDELLVEKTIIDLRRVPLEVQDEALGLTDGARANISDTLIIGAKKGALCGSGVHPDLDKNGRVSFTGCVFIDCGRRCPEAQDGMDILLHKCWIHNWGSRFDVRSFGAWSHHNAHILAIRTLFTQPRFSFLNFWKDLGNHFCHSFQEHYPTPSNMFMPGICRGLTATAKGSVKAMSCWKNKWWIRLQNSVDPMTNDEAYDTVKELHCKLLDGYERILGYTLLDLYETL